MTIIVETRIMAFQDDSLQLARSKTSQASEAALENKPLPKPSFCQFCSRIFSHPLPRCLLSKRLPQLPAWLQLTGWRGTAAAGGVLSVISLLINIFLFAWGKGRSTDLLTGAPILFEGSCSRMQSIYTWSHLGINAFSSLLLGASNATMQCLMSPTRSDIDEAHAKGRWLDVGMSGTNWLAMQGWRKLLWVLLIATSIPLHIL